MKPNFLFPHWFRYLGWGCVIAHVPLSMLGHAHGMTNALDQPTTAQTLFNAEHLFFITTALLMALGLFFVAFAKERMEDEQIWLLRLDSLRWAIYINYIILLVSLVWVSDTAHILELNLWIPLLFFIIRFRWLIYRLNSSLKEDIK